MKKFTASLILSLIICLGFSIISNANEIENTTSKFIRLHVIANSDSEYDQELKLKVRDKTLEIIDELAYECTDKDEADEVISSSVKSIENTLQLYLNSIGCNDSIKVEYGMAFVDKREYDTFTLPAGRYTALTVKIGEAEGKNWWCVLYPELCTSAAHAGETLIKTGFSKDQIDILTGGEKPQYRLKFKILEFFQQGICE